MSRLPEHGVPFRLAVLSEDGVDEPQGADLAALLEELAQTATREEETE